MNVLYLLSLCHWLSCLQHGTGCTQRLLNKGADPECQDEYGKCALVLTAFYGHVLMVDALIAAGKFWIRSIDDV